MKSLMAMIALILSAPLMAQIPTPQINLTGNIGAQGFPVLNNGTLTMSADASRTMTPQESSAVGGIKVTSTVSLTATRNLIIPAGNFQFIAIENATAGGQSIQVIGPTGTGVTIANGNTATVWFDGTNVVQSAGVGVQFNPAATQVINQPSGTSLQVSNLNGVFNAALLMTGGDLASGVRQGITQLAGDCGTILIPHGSYTWSTQVTMPKCVTIEGNGSVVNVPVMSTPALVIAGLPTTGTPQTYSPGQVSNVTFQGAGPSNTATIGIFYGGDGTGTWTPNTYQAYLTKFDNVHVTGFGHGVQLGLGFQFTWVGGVIENNNIGIDEQNNIGFVENVSFIGTEILNNVQQGIYFAQTGVNVELNLTDTSEDYNAQTYSSGSNITFTNGILNMSGGHLEGPTLPFIKIPAPGAATTVNASLQGVGMTLADLNSAHTYTSFISYGGLNTNFYLGSGNNFISDGAAVTAALNILPVSGGSVGLFISPYVYNVQISGILQSTTLQPYTGTTPTEYLLPVFNSTGGTLMGSISSSQVTANGINDSAALFTLGSQSGTATSLVAMNFYTNATSTPTARIQTDGTAFSFQNYTGSVHLPITVGGVTGTLWSPLPSTTAPSGACTVIGQETIAADGSLSYCDPNTNAYRKLFASGIIPAYIATGLTAGCANISATGVITSTGSACGSGGGNTTTSGGTAATIPVLTAGTSQGNSALSQDSATSPTLVTSTVPVKAPSYSTTGAVQVTIQGPSSGTSYTVVLPGTASSGCLIGTASGTTVTTTWGACGAASSRVTLSSANPGVATVTVTGSYTALPACQATDQSKIAAVQCVPSLSGSTVTLNFYGTTSDVIQWSVFQVTQ